MIVQATVDGTDEQILFLTDPRHVIEVNDVQYSNMQSIFVTLLVSNLLTSNVVNDLHPETYNTYL